jgi:hypothetical protein
MPVMTRDQILSLTGGSMKGEDVWKASQGGKLFSPDDYDSAMGIAKGTSQAWLDKNKPAPVTETPNTPAGLTKQQVLDGTQGSMDGLDILEASRKYGWSQGWLDRNVPKDGPNTAMTPTRDRFQGYNPSSITITPEMNVQEQVNGILARGGPMMERAGAQGTRYANRRGLLNSTMGAEASQNAVIDKALDIAVPDAQMRYNVALANQQSINRSREFTADAGNQAASIKAQTAGNATLQRDAAARERELQLELQKQRGDQQDKSDATNAETDRINEANRSVALLNSQHQVAIAQILANETMSPEQKQAMIDKLNEQLQVSLSWIGKFTDVDTGNLVDFSGSAPQEGPTGTGVLANLVRDANTTARASGGSEAEVIQQAYDNAVSRGLTLEQAAKELGISPQKAAEKLAQIGLSL